MHSGFITVSDGLILVRSPFALKDALKQAGGWWEPLARVWTFPASPEAAHVVRTILPWAKADAGFESLVRATIVRDPEQKYTSDAPEIPGLSGSSWIHQRQAYAEAMSRPATMLALGLGAGKTRVAIGCILNRDVRRVLVLCPLSVVPVWPAEFQRHARFGSAPVLPLMIGSVTSKAIRARLWLATAQSDKRLAVIVVNYDAARAEPFRSWSLVAGFDMVVLDESQRVKAPGGVTSRYVAALGRLARYRLCLSGTPAAHSPLDLYGQYRFLDPTIFGTSFLRFRMHYAIYGGYENHQVLGYQNVEELNRKFHSIAFQVGREVLDLPDATDVTRYCELGAEARRIYRELATALYARLDSGELTVANSMVALLRLQQLVGGYLQDDDGTLNEIDHAKRDLLAEALEEIGPDEGVVVFCRFRRDLDTVAEVAGPSILELSGRRNELARWQAGEGRVLAVQIQAGSLGVSMVRARYVIMFSVGYSLADYEQARARVHRPGQDRAVTYVRLVASDTVDEVIYDALAQRRDVIEAVITRRR